jgi:CHAT domain-containing protein
MPGLCRADAAGGFAAPREGLFEPLQVTAETDPVTGAAVSRDGGTIFYITETEGVSALWRGSADPAAFSLPEQVAPADTAKRAPALAPDGQQAAYVDTGHDAKGDIYAIALNRQDAFPVRLTGRASAEDAPAFSPDGRTLYFHEILDTGRRRIVSLDLENPQAPPEPAATGGDAAFPAISPDGRMLAFVSNRKDPAGDIYVCRLADRKAAGPARRVTRGTAIDSSPAWGASRSDGAAWLYFSRTAADTNRDGRLSGEDNAVLCRISPDAKDTGPARPLTLLSNNAAAPCIAGGRLYFLSDRRAVSNCWAIPSAGRLEEKKTASQQLALAQTISARVPDDPYTSLLAYVHVMERFAGSAAVSAEAGLCAARIYERLHLTASAREMFAYVAGRYAEVRPGGGVARIREIELKAREEIDAAATSRAKMKILEAALPRIAEMENGASSEAAVRASAVFARVRLLTGLAQEAAGLLELKQGLDRVLADADAVAAHKAQALFLKAGLLERTGLSEAAKQSLRQLLKRFPGQRPWSDRALEQLLDAALRSGREPRPAGQAASAGETGLKAQVRILRRISAASRESLPILSMAAANRIGDIHYARDQWEKAKSAYQAVIAESMGSGKNLASQAAAARLSLAEILYREERFRKALDLYETEIRLRAEVDRIYQLARAGYIRKTVSAGNFHYRLGELAAARSRFRELLDYDETIVEAHRGYIKCAAAAGEIEKAIAGYESRRERNPAHDLWLYTAGLARSYREAEHELDAAAERIEKAIQRNGHVPYYHQTLGYIREMLETVHGRPQQLERALAAYKKAYFLSDARANPENTASLELNLGNAYYLLGQYGEALRFYTRRLQRETGFFRPEAELIFYKRLGECAFQAADAAQAESAYRQGLAGIEARMAPRAPAERFQRLHRLIRDRILSPARKLSALERRARLLAEKQAKISSAVSKLAEAAAPPPGPAWAEYRNAARRLLERQRKLNPEAAALARDLNRLCAAGKCRAYMERPEEMLQRMTENIESALALPESLVTFRAEMTDRLGLALQARSRHKAAVNTFETAFELNQSRGAYKNLARNRRSAALNTYYQARAAFGEKRRRLLEKAAAGFRRVLALIEAHGVPEPEKEEKQALIDITFQAALDAESATHAARGFTREQEERLAHAFLSRIALELGDLETARRDLEKQLSGYPPGGSVPDKDRYGAALLYHRAGLVAHALGAHETARDRFVESARLCLSMQAPVGTLVNLLNLAAVLEARLAGEPEEAAIEADLNQFQEFDSRGRRLLENAAATAGTLRLAGYHNAAGVFYTLAAQKMTGDSARTLARRILALSRSAAHLTAGLRIVSEDRIRPGRSLLQARARLHLNQAVVCRMLGEAEKARDHLARAVAAARRGLFPSLEWRGLSGLGRLEEAFSVVQSLTPLQAGCQPMEILRAFGPLVVQELRTSGPEAAFLLAEEIAELERYNRTARFLQFETAEAGGFFRARLPRLSRIADYRQRLSAAGPEQEPYLRERLEQELDLLRSEGKAPPGFISRIEEESARFSVMRALGALFSAEAAAEKIAARNLEEQEPAKPLEDLREKHAELAAEYREAVSALVQSRAPEAVKRLFTPQPAGAMDIFTALEPDRRLLRVFPAGTVEEGYLVFVLEAEEITAQTAGKLEDIKAMMASAARRPAPYLAFEDPAALAAALAPLSRTFPQAMSATHLYRAHESRKPFKHRLLEVAREPGAPSAADAFEPLSWQPGADIGSSQAAYTLEAAHTLVISSRIASAATVPTRPGETAAPYLGVRTAEGVWTPLHALLSRTESLSLAILPPPPAGELDRVVHLLSLHGCPTAILFCRGPSPEEDRVEAFLSAYAGMRALDAAEAATRPDELLYIGMPGLSPDASRALARQSFSGYVKAGRSAFDAGDYPSALVRFSEAADIAEQVEAFGRYLPAIHRYARESAYNAGNLEKALAHAETLAGILASRKPRSRAHAESLRTLGLIHAKLGQYEPAVQAIGEAVEMLAGPDADDRLAPAMTDLGVVLENAGRYEDALLRFQAAAELFRELDNREMLAAQHLHLGRIHDLRLNRYPDAIRHYEKALSLYRGLGAPAKAAEAGLDIGRCYRLLGVFAKAEAFYEGALAALGPVKGRNERILIKIRIEQANNAWFQGDYETAFRKQRICAELSRKNRLPLLQVVSANTAGLIWWSLGRYEKALNELESALQTARELSIREDEVASTLNNIGLVHRATGAYQKALDAFDRALEIDARTGSRWAMAYDYRNKGLTRLEMKQPEAALALFEEALSLSTAIGNRINMAKAWLGKADALLSLNRPDAAKTAYREALSLSREMRIKETQWRALYGLGRISREYEENNREAEQYLREAMEIIESMRSAIKIKELKENFMVGRLAVYEALVGLLSDMGKPAAAFSVAERSRSRNFIDLLGTQRITLASRAESALFEKQAMLRSEIEAAEMLLASARTQKEKRAYEASLKNRKNRLENLLTDIQADHPRLSALVSIPPVSADAVKARLSPGVALLSYYVLDSEILCWILGYPEDASGPNPIRLVRIPADREKLKADVLDYRRTIQNLEPFEARSTSLYDRLIAPVRAELTGIHTAGIIPHGPLHYLSYATLFDGGRYLIDAFSLFYLPSASVLDYTLDRRRKGPKTALSVLAVGNPDLENPALELPFAEPEVNSIQWNFPEITILTRGRATEAWVVANIARFDIIHIASHGEFDPVNPLLSAIKLSSSEEASEKKAAVDGDLRAAEVFGLDINADMVCLSACQTGLGRVEAGDEIIGLNRSFFYAGTHTVVSSLWRVSDVATAMLVKTFYRRYTARNKADSLRDAARHVRQSYPHPGYWGAFTLVGDFK